MCATGTCTGTPGTCISSCPYNANYLYTGGKSLQQFSPAGNLIKQLNLPTGVYSYSFFSNIAFDPSGNFWVSDLYGGVYKYNSSGIYTGISFGKNAGTGNGQFSSYASSLGTWGIAVDASGNVWVTDSWANRIQEFDTNGNYLNQLTVPFMPSDTKTTSAPVYIALGKDGTIWVQGSATAGSNSFYGYLQGYTTSKTWIQMGSSLGSKGGINMNMQGLTIDPSGNIWVGDQANNGMAKYDPTGNYLNLYVNLPGTPSNLTSDPNGNIYVATEYSNVITEYNSSGSLVNTFTLANNPDPAAGGGHSWNNSPMGLALLPCCTPTTACPSSSGCSTDSCGNSCGTCSGSTTCSSTTNGTPGTCNSNTCCSANDYWGSCAPGYYNQGTCSPGFRQNGPASCVEPVCQGGPLPSHEISCPTNPWPSNNSTNYSLSPTGYCDGATPCQATCTSGYRVSSGSCVANMCANNNTPPTGTTACLVNPPPATNNVQSWSVIDSVSSSSCSSSTACQAYCTNTTPYTITASEGAGATISPLGAVHVYCGSQSFTITTAACSPECFDVSTTTTVDGVASRSDNVMGNGSTSTYTFNNVTASHTIAASATTYVILAPMVMSGSGSVTVPGCNYPPGNSACSSNQDWIGPVGSSPTFTFVPSAGYHVADVVWGSSDSLGAVSSYTFSNIQSTYLSMIYVYFCATGQGWNGSTFTCT